MLWHGPVEHLFFHTLVIHPKLAFTSEPIGQGFREWFVTVDEFRKILDQLYANGWTLVDINRAAHGEARVPPGRKPLVISEDDVNYYDNTRAASDGSSRSTGTAMSRSKNTTTRASTSPTTTSCR